MKEITKIKNILQRRGKINKTSMRVMLLDESNIEVRVLFDYTPNPKARNRDVLQNMYNIFDKCRRIISGDKR